MLMQKPKTANRIASVTLRANIMRLELHGEWEFEEEDESEEPINFNPYCYKESCCAKERLGKAFDASISCRKILIDKVKLPEDYCEAISKAIEKGTARAISDGSYNPDLKMGTSGFKINTYSVTESLIPILLAFP